MTSVPGMLTGASSTDFGAAIVIIAILVTLRIYRGMKGTRFTTIGLYRLPGIYLILTVLELLSANPSYLDVVIAAVALVAGLLVGLMVAGGVQFFERNNRVYYKRSPVIMIIWLVSYIARFAVETIYPGVPYIAIIVDFVLAGTTGMIIGEAFHIKRSYEAYRKKVGAPEA